MVKEKSNAAVEIRYSEWFKTFTENSNENERQNAIMELLLERIKERVPTAFSHAGEKPPVFVDLMCGPGDMSRYYKMALQKIGLKNVRACGLELRDDHITEWKRKLDTNDIVIQGDIGDPNLDITKSFGLDDDEKPVAAFWGHGGYYLYQSKEGTEKISNSELSDQPALASVVSLIHDILGPNGISISVHKAIEWTDIVKQHFTSLAESNTTEALYRIYDKQGIRNYSLTFECKLTPPQITPDVRRRLTGEILEDYGQMEIGQAKIARQILEFLVHTPLEELGKAEYNNAHDTVVSFAEFNLEKRKQYVAYIDELMQHHNGVIPTYVDFIVSVSPQASPDFADLVIKTIRDVNNEVGKTINMPEFLRVKQEIESKVVGAQQLVEDRKEQVGRNYDHIHSKIA